MIPAISPNSGTSHNYRIGQREFTDRSNRWHTDRDPLDQFFNIATIVSLPVASMRLPFPAAASTRMNRSGSVRGPSTITDETVCLGTDAKDCAVRRADCSFSG